MPSTLLPVSTLQAPTPQFTVAEKLVGTACSVWLAGCLTNWFSVHPIVTNSSEIDGWSAMVRSKSAFVAPIPNGIAAI